MSYKNLRSLVVYDQQIFLNFLKSNKNINNFEERIKYLLNEMYILLQKSIKNEKIIV